MRRSNLPEPPDDAPVTTDGEVQDGEVQDDVWMTSREAATCLGVRIQRIYALLRTKKLRGRVITRPHRSYRLVLREDVLRRKRAMTEHRELRRLEAPPEMEAGEEPGRWMSLKETMRALHMAERKLRRLVAGGTIRARDSGRLRLFDPESVRAYQQKRIDDREAEDRGETRLVSAATAIRLLGISKQRFYQLIEDGWLRAVEPGKYNRAVVEGLVDLRSRGYGRPHRGPEKATKAAVGDGETTAPAA